MGPACYLYARAYVGILAFYQIITSVYLCSHAAQRNAMHFKRAHILSQDSW